MSDERKKQFILKLAAFLVENQAGKSIALQIQSPNAPVQWATEWANLRNASPLHGYPTLEEAVEQLTDWLG